MTSKDPGGDKVCTEDVSLETINSLRLYESPEIEKSESLEDLKCKPVIDSTLSMQKKIYGRDFEVPDWLNDFESPFSWQLQVKTRVFQPEFLIKRCVGRLQELSVKDSEYTSKRSTLLLKQVVEYYIMGQEQECWVKIKDLEATLNEAKEEARVKEDHPYLKIRRVLDHFVNVTKAYLKVLYGQEEEARKILEGVTPVQMFSNEELVYLYLRKVGYFVTFDCRSQALELNNKALELDPDNANVLISKAKTLRQIRRDSMFSTEVPDEEIYLIKKAMEICSAGSEVKVNLAQVSREYADTMMKLNRKAEGFYKSETFKTIEHFQKEALRLYMEALNENPVNCENGTVLFRVGYGIIKLPQKMIGPDQYKLALKCLNQALEISERGMTLQVLAEYYSRIENDKTKALEYLDRAIEQFQSDQALIDKVKIKFQMDPNYDPIPDLTIGLDLDICRKSKVVEIWAQMGSYFLLIKRDLIKSLGAFSQALNASESLNLLKAFRVIYLLMYEPINLLEYIVNECKIKLMDLNELTGEEKTNHAINLTLVQEFHDKIIKLEPDLGQMKANPDLIDDLLQLSDLNFKNLERSKQKHQFRPNKFNQRGTFNRNWGNQAKSNLETTSEQIGSNGISNKPTQWERFSERTFYKNSPYYLERSRFSHTTAGYSGQGSNNNQGRALNGFDQNNYRYQRNCQQNRGSCLSRRDEPVENWRQK